MRDLRLVSFLYIVNSTGGISPVECKKKENRLAQTRGAPKLDREVAAIIIQKVTKSIQYHMTVSTQCTLDV